MGIDLSLKIKAIQMRKEGASYSTIQKTLNLKSKGTLSTWFKTLKLSKTSLRLLSKNHDLALRRGLLKANADRQLRIKNDSEEAFTKGAKLIKKLSKKDLMIIGAALYWGEGAKSFRNTIPYLDFSNSDHQMLRVFMRFLREILNIKEEKIRSGIHLYPHIDHDEAKLFWSKVTGLPMERFYVVTQVSKASQSKRPINLLPYGTLSIRVNNRAVFYKMKGMISGLIDML